MKYDSEQRYGSITRLLHWGMAFLIGWQMLKFFDAIDEGEHFVGQVLVPFHVSIGTLLLVLVVARLIWVGRQPARPPQSGPTAMLAKAGHRLLYLAIVLLPVLGILKMVGGGYGLTAFGLTIIPEGAKIGWMSTVGDLHSPVAWLLLLLVIAHITGALLHALVWKDGVFGRMT